MECFPLPYLYRRDKARNVSHNIQYVVSFYQNTLRKSNIIQENNMEMDLRRSLFIKDMENSKLKQVITETRNELEKVKLQYAEDLRQFIHGNENFKQSEELNKSCTELETQLQKLYEENKKLRNSININSHKEIDRLTQLENLEKQNRELKLQIEEMSLKHHKELHHALGSLNRTKEENKKFNIEINDFCKQLQDLKWEVYGKDLQLAEIKNKLKESLRKAEYQEVLENQLRDLRNHSTNISLNAEESEENKQRIINLLRKNKLLTEENKTLQQQNEKLVSRHTHQIKDITNLQCLLEESRQNVLELNRNILCLQKLEGSIDKTNEVSGLYEKEENGEDLTLKIEELLVENSSLKQKVENLEMSNYHKLKIITKLKLSNESRN